MTKDNCFGIKVLIYKVQLYMYKNKPCFSLGQISHYKSPTCPDFYSQVDASNIPSFGKIKCFSLHVVLRNAGMDIGRICLVWHSPKEKGLFYWCHRL